MLFMLIIAQATYLHAQTIDTVCAGDREVMYAVEGSLNSQSSTFVWSVEGGNYQPYSAEGDTILVNWGNTSGEYNIQVIEISDFGCEGNPVAAKVKINDSPVVDLGDEENICEGEEYVFNLGQGYTDYLWHDGSSSSTLVVSEGGQVWARVLNEYGCANSDTVNLTVHGLPQVDLGNDTTVCGTSELRVYDQNEGDYVFYSWSTGDISSEITITEGARLVWVEVEDQYGCISSDTLLISRCNPNDFIGSIPNAFTPNGDGENDKWEIRNLQYFPDAQLVIYDRWGRLIYQCDGGCADEAIAWDGKNRKGKRMPMDSYYYIIKLNHENADPISGTVTLVR
jgi:gliding motility-associated-like protein